MYYCCSLTDLKVETPLPIQMKALWKKLVKAQYQTFQKTMSILNMHILRQWKKWSIVDWIERLMLRR